MRRDWGPRHPRVPIDETMEALSDRTRTCREVARDFGYSQRWMAALSVELGIERKRGGDRRSPAARVRFGNGVRA